MSNWIRTQDQKPDKTEPVVYLRKKPGTRNQWHVGIAYWTVSEQWKPEAYSDGAPQGFTHWMALPEPPIC